MGLANIISLFTLLILGWKETLIVVILRTIISSMYGGSLSTFLFSITGGLLSNIVMILLYKYFKDAIGISSISICGAIFHNIGQLFVAAIYIQDFKIYIYLPVLLVSAVVTGFFVGVAVNFLHNHFKAQNWLKN